MREFLEYNPVTGVSDYLEIKEIDGRLKAITTQEQDMEPFLRRAHELRVTGATNIGIKNGLWCYATIPTVVQLEMKKKGIDIYNPNHAKLAKAEINANYPYLKLTEKRI